MTNKEPSETSGRLKDMGNFSGTRTHTAAIFILLGVLVFAGLFFYPKQRVIGGLRGGPIGLNASAYRADYTCLGVKYDFCPNWPDYGCDQLCFGWVTRRACILETYSSQGLVQQPAACEQGNRPRWGFPPNR